MSYKYWIQDLVNVIYDFVSTVIFSWSDNFKFVYDMYKGQNQKYINFGLFS